MPIKITAKKDGFRRCGVAHPATPTTHPDDAFTQDQIDILMAEPALVVEIVKANDAKSEPDDEASEIVQADNAKSEPDDEASEIVQADDAKSEPDDEARKVINATMTVKKLEEELTKMGVALPVKYTKADLVELIVTHTVEPASGAE